jgi:predicted DsbA family dithiol-disulfide isomerase
MKLESDMAPEDHIVMVPKLQIDFVSDVACPWCAIGLFGLEEALRRLNGVVDADVRFQPFELNPAMGPAGQNLDEHIAEKYGGSSEQLAAGRQMLRERAAGVGFAFNSSANSRVYNTFDAHRLLHWATSQGCQREFKRALFKANFTDDANVSDPEVLAALAASAGLDPAEAREILSSRRYATEVREAENSWTSRGIHAVPGVIINGKWLISGGQPPEIFEQALRNIATELTAETART